MFAYHAHEVTVYMCDAEETALHKASWNGETECVSIILEHGADVNRQHKSGGWLCVTGLLLRILS